MIWHSRQAAAICLRWLGSRSTTLMATSCGGGRGVCIGRDTERCEVPASTKPCDVGTDISCPPQPGTQARNEESSNEHEPARCSSAAPGTRDQSGRCPGAPLCRILAPSRSCTLAAASRGLQGQAGRREGTQPAGDQRMLQRGDDGGRAHAVRREQQAAQRRLPRRYRTHSRPSTRRASAAAPTAVRVR